MLIDDAIETFTGLAARPRGWVSPVLSERIVDYLGSLQQAASYSLSEDTARFLESLAPDTKTAAATLEDIKLPHDVLFVEYPFLPVADERMRRGGQELQPDEIQPRKIGILVRKAHGKILASILAPADGSPTNTPAIELDFDGFLSEGFSYSGVRYLFPPREPERDEQLLEAMIDDVMSELSLIMTFLLFLNGPDAETLVESEVVPAPKLNQSRLRKGKIALRPYRHVTLGRYGRMHLDIVSADRDEDRIGVRAHFVRGHNMRSHGRVVWRRLHIRGGKDADSVPAAVRAHVRL